MTATAMSIPNIECFASNISISYFIQKISVVLTRINFGQFTLGRSLLSELDSRTLGSLER